LPSESNLICFIESLILNGSKIENGLEQPRGGKELITLRKTRRTGTTLQKLTQNIFPGMHWWSRSFLFGTPL